MKVIIAVTVLCALASANAFKLDNPSSYIINGDNVSAVVPYYAYLEIYQLPNFDGNIFFGGAVLITSNAVVTVAQNAATFQSWRVGLGGYRIQDLEWFIVATSHVHMNYDPNTLANNIAVLRLASAVTLSERIMPISRLPDVLPLPNDGDVTDIVGFGFGENPNQPNILQEAQLTVLSQEECGNAYPHLVASGQLDNHFCASNATTRSNICAGDQGGPIVGRILSSLLLGIQSFNRQAECGLPESQPAAFIRINRYQDFINNALLN